MERVGRKIKRLKNSVWKEFSQRLIVSERKIGSALNTVDGRLQQKVKKKIRYVTFLM